MHAQNHLSCEGCPKTLPRSFSVMSISYQGIQFLTILQHIGRILAIFSLCMCRNGHLGASTKKF